MSQHKPGMALGGKPGGSGGPAEEAGPWDLVLGFARGWDRFWFSSASPLTLCLMRIGCGLILFYVHLTYSWGLFSYLGADGWVDVGLANYIRDKSVINAPGWKWEDANASYESAMTWSVFYHVTSPGWVRALHIASLLVMLAFTLGLWTRWTAILSWIAAISYIYRSQWTVFGLDTMMIITLTYLCLAPCGAALSLDRVIERWRARKAGLALPEGAEPSVLANFTTRLLQVHFCIIYLAAGTSKLLGPSWWSGTAPNLVVNNYEFAPFNVPGYQALLTFVAENRWLWEAVMTSGVAFTLFTELGLPFLIWDRRWRWFMICCSVLLHTMIGIFMGLVTFSLIMLVMLLAFVPPEAVRQGVDRLQARIRKYLAERKTRQRPERTLVLTR